MQRRGKAQKGQSLIETSLTIMVFFALVIGVMDLGQMLFLNQTLVERARVAARWGAVHAFDRTAMENLVLFGTVQPAEEQSPFWGLSRSNVQVTNPGCTPARGTGCRVNIVISGFSYPLVSSAAGHPARIAVALPVELP